MKFIFSVLSCFLLITSFGQDIVHEDEFDNNILSVGGNPTGYTMALVNESFQITGNGAAGPWTAMSYYIHDGAGNAAIVDASENPKLYIKAKGENQPSLRIDFQDQTGYLTNQNPIEINIDNNYKIYEFDFVGRLLDGAYGGPCMSAPCIVDASKLQALIIFINAPTGGYSGTVDIDWISIGAPLEDFDPSSFHEIRYNQISYLMDQKKLFNVVADAPFDPIEYRIYEEGNTTPILEGMTNASAIWQPSNEYVSTVDFSEINDPGNYRIETSNASADIKISQNGYEDLCEASLKYYYFNRASQELTSEYAGPWARPLGHADENVIVHSSAASASRPAGTRISSPKGWYDAGDYNKYIVNSGISTYTLLAAYEHYEEYYNNLSLAIPEQGGDLPDILDEVIWNLDWMLSMQDPADGGVYHKLTGLNFSGIVMPHQYNFDRYVVQKTTAAALNFAAVLATASRIFENFEQSKPGYSATLIDAAKQAYAWAEANPTIYYNQPSNVSTGQYGDGNVTDEFDWAASELLITTGEIQYVQDINENSIGNGVPAWPYTAPLALISLAHHQDVVDDYININIIENKLLATANQLRNTVNQSSMKVAMGSTNGDFVWGSNGNAGNQIIMLIRAYEITDDKSYLDAAYLALEYLLGRNGTGFCYVSGFGDKSPQNPHHRPSEADNVSAPVPGMVAGGPNPGRQDGCSGYIGSSPANAYVDSWCSYASNEVTINWNAPLAYSVNALQFYQTGIISSAEEIENIKTNTLELYPNPGFDTIVLGQMLPGENKSLQIFNAEGKLVFQLREIISSTIDVSSLTKGIYLIQLVEEKRVSTAKWLKM